MTKKLKLIFTSLTVCLMLITPIYLIVANHPLKQGHASQMSAPTIVKHVPKTKAPQQSNQLTDYWQQPSEDKPYPNVAHYANLSVDVSIHKQRVYLKAGKQTLYTMLASTGKDGGTPTGTFKIEAERGQKFYNSESKEGANYWVSFKDHGIYLFHTVPTNQAGTYDLTQAKQLGKQANSHGCIRLSVADAKWFFENIPENTPVHIYN
ncbi:L,D-transpeptidase [Agrilactobacillus fermenti]|uniref:L,D-transpeptidase n=1 Tax=Agrilactobacillus fermenti TaxID=2586909 RepID=UPI003A5C4E01